VTLVINPAVGGHYLLPAGAAEGNEKWGVKKRALMASAEARAYNGGINSKLFPYNSPYKKPPQIFRNVRCPILKHVDVSSGWPTWKKSRPGLEVNMTDNADITQSQAVTLGIVECRK